MKLNFIFAPLLFTLSDAQTSARLADMSEVFRVPSELQSLINSVESQASSAASEIKPVFSSAATVIPPELLSKARDILPVETPSESISGGTSNMGAGLSLANGVVAAAVGSYLMN
ncbi:hypothetical protein GQ44DRAFT_731142 [Phaeosphaeriaceae sp. PMI808]|nr:hypothetical protein GQ44DRAFT_731142 [Phaeosphaeriaceae sp. PMI808]